MNTKKTENYINKIANAVGEKCGISIDNEEYGSLLRLYALLALTTGSSTTLENVHDAWSAWRSNTVPDHKSLIPFQELSKEVQELDRPYRDAIREVSHIVRETK